MELKMLTAFLGLNIAFRIFTLDAIHTGLEVSLTSAEIRPNVYVHVDWATDRQNVVGT
jgi:hypothetical protein